MQNTPRAIDHIAIRVSDIEEALAFYTDKLGLTVDDDGGPAEKGTRALLVGDTRIHLRPEYDSNLDPAFEDHFCLVYPSGSGEPETELAKFAEKLKDDGVTIVNGDPTKRPGPFGDNYRIHVEDPDGRDIEIRMY